VCGRFIAFEDFDDGAEGLPMCPDSLFTREMDETRCKECWSRLAPPGR
jgi:hypothetical protein